MSQNEPLTPEQVASAVDGCKALADAVRDSGVFQCMASGGDADNIRTVLAALDATRARLSAAEDDLQAQMSNCQYCYAADAMRERAEAELAKVRPVVEAAKAWHASWGNESESALGKAVAALSASGEAYDANAAMDHVDDEGEAPR